MPTTRIKRLIAKNILLMFAITLLVLTSAVMLMGIAREAINQGLGLIGVAKLIPYALPNALALAVPGTALFSVCCIFGRMSADNELVAMQSVGISPLSAISPALWITTLLSLATVGLINTAFTWGHNGIERVVLSSLDSIAYRVLERDRSFQRGPLSMTVRDVDDKRLIGPNITIRQSEGSPICIDAREASITYSDEVGGLTLSLINGSATFMDGASFQFPDTFVHTVPLRSHPPYDLLTANPSHMPMADLSPATIEQGSDIRRRANQIAVHTGFDVMTSKLDDLIGGSSEHRLTLFNQSRMRLPRLRAELHRRWASGFTCLALALVGIPLAIRLKTSDAITSFGICFLPTLLVYYPVFALTLDMAKDGRLPPSAVWIANVMCFALGIWMIRKSLYSPA